MSHPCSKAAMRVLISVLLASSVANAAALPHQVLDARAPAAIQNANAEVAAEAIQAAATAIAKDPENFFEEVSDGLNNRTGWEVFRDFFTRLFGPREGDNNAEATVTVTVAPVPIETVEPVEVSASAGASISLDIIVPPGPSITPSAAFSEVPYTTAAPTTEDIFSILPIGDLTTSINATELTPIFITAPASDLPIPTASAIEIIPPFPIANGTTIDVLLPTAVSITGEFSVMMPLVTDIPTSATANASEPVETLVGPIGTGVPVVNVTVPLGTGVPVLNVTVPLGTGIPVVNVTVSSESVIPLVTEVPVVLNLTVTPVETIVAPLETANLTVPIGTGVVSMAPTPVNSSAPAGTGFVFLVPIANATKLPLNATAVSNNTVSSMTVVVVTETVIPVPVTVTGIEATASAGTGLPIVIVASALWPNSTYNEPTGITLPIGTAVPLGTGTALLSNETALPLNTTIGVPLGTGIPLLTGVPAPSVGTALPLPVSESPVYPNTTTATSTSTLIIPIPILVTGIPEPATVNVTIPPTPISDTVDELASLTELPLTVTGTPGNVLNINVTIPIAPFANSTAGLVDASTVLPLETMLTASVGTGLPIATLTADASAPFANTTLPAPTAVVEASAPAILILPAPVETTTTEDDGLSSLRAICQDPKIHTLTLPLIDRFYGRYAYPSLHPFPGCTTPNERQAIQAPGLLNCSALGAEVQTCQAMGKKVLLSVKGSGVGDAAGNVDFGDPNVGTEPFGKTFAISGGSVSDGAEGKVYAKDKRQADRPLGQALPVFNVTGEPPYPILNGSKVLEVDGAASSPTTRRPMPLSLLIPPTATPSAGQTPVPVDDADLVDLTDSVMSCNHTRGWPMNAGPIPCSKDPIGNLPTIPSSSDFPNLFDEHHPPSAFALTLFSLFGEGHTERADLRPLGPDVPSGASPPVLNGTDWTNPILTALQRPLGEEVVVDGFDVQVPAEWQGHYQDKKFKDLMTRLKELHQEAWIESGGVVGGPADLGADGKGVVYEGYIGGSLRVRSVGLEVRAELKRVGWVEWDPLAQVSGMAS